MATPTALEVVVDSEEYSRYERDKDTITATIVVTGGAPYVAEQIIVDLVKARRSRDAVVATATLTISNAADPYEAVVTFYLPDIVDQDLINLVRHGRYLVRATSVSDDTIIGESPDFDVSVVSVERLKRDFLFGVPLTATEVKAPKFQPSAITGLSIVEVSPGTALGAIQLNYVYHKDHITNATAVIGSGVDGTVTITADEDNAGDDGNIFTVLVQVPSGTSGLTASVAGAQLIVNLAVVADVPDDPQNTATLVAAAIDALDGFSAVASGTGATALTLAEGPTQFSGGVSNTVRQISWDGGPLVSLTTSGVVILMSGGASCGPKKVVTGSTDYICIRVTSVALLPTQSISETILMERKKMDDDALRTYLCQALAWVENDFLQTPIEPTNVVTERDPTLLQYSAGGQSPAPLFTDTDFDAIVSPLTYFAPHDSGRWIFIQTPWPQLLRVDSLFGAVANTRVIDIDIEWIEHSEQGGVIQLVPFTAQQSFNFIGLTMVNALRGAAEIPNFWHYNAIVGLREATCDILELVAKKAAMDALVVLGTALRPGVGSVSLSRDGVSESVSYVTSAQYGMFTGHIQAYKDWIKEEGDRLRAKYRGVLLRVV